LRGCGYRETARIRAVERRYAPAVRKHNESAAGDMEIGFGGLVVVNLVLAYLFSRTIEKLIEKRCDQLEKMIEYRCDRIERMLIGRD
jgi:hypothetical protein